MAVSHVKSNPVANMTGTVTVFNSAGVTTTAAATDLVRPLDWNSAHNQFMTIGGNTVGASTLSGTNIVFEGAGAVTLSGNADTLVFSAPVQTAFVLSNSNGLTFGTNVSTVTASHNGLTSQSNQAYSAGNGSAAFQTLTFANSNGVSFSTGTQGLFGTVKTDYASSNHSHGNPTLALTNLSGTTASNSAGLTLSLSAAAAGGAATATLYATGNTTQSSTGTMALSSMIVRGAGGISAGISNGSIVVSGPDLTSLAATGALSASSNGSTISLGVGTVTVSAVSNTTQNSSGTVNLNALQIQGAGVASVGLSNGSVVISVPSGGGAGDGGNVIAAGTQTGTSLGTIKFENSNGITFGMSGSTQVTASHNGLTTARASNDAIGLNTAQTNVTWTVNSSGLSINAAGYAGTGSGFTGGASISGSMTHDSQGLSLSLSHPAWLTTAAQSNHSHGNPTLALTNLSGTTASNSAGLTLSLSAAAPGGNGIAAAAGTQTATSGTINFANSNGVTFGMSGSSQITASHNGLTTARASNDAIGLNAAQTNVTWTVNSSGLSLNAAGYAGTGTTFNGTNASASMTLNSNGLRLDLSAANGGGGVNTGTFYATGNTTQSSSGTIALSSIIVQGTGGVSAGVSNGSIVVSGPALTSLSATGALSVSSNGSTISLGVGTVTVSATGNTTQASSGTVNLNGLILQGTGGASVGISNGSIVISGATGGAGGGAAISAGANSQSTGTVNFANSNGITFGLSNNGTMTASYNSTQFAGTGTTFAGANISASMTLNSNGLNLSASVAAPGAAAENNNINLLGANTAGNTTASGSTIGLSGLNLTLSGTNASQVVISAPATSSLVGVGGISISTNGSTISISQVPSSRYVNENAVTTTGLAADRSSVSIVPFMIQHQLDMSNMRCLISMSGQTTTNNSTNGAAISISGVLYSLNGSSLSSILSGSNTYTGTWSSNATASVFGARALTMNFNNTTRLAPGEYWWAVHVSSATTAANTSGTSNLTHAFTMGIGAANLTQMLGDDPWGQATAATRGVSVGLGILSTGATRASIAISEIQQTGSRAQAAKLWLDMRNYSVW